MKYKVENSKVPLVSKLLICQQANLIAIQFTYCSTKHVD
jgi:hypothetical protein